jgi:hypothetical protein
MRRTILFVHWQQQLTFTLYVCLDRMYGGCLLKQNYVTDDSDTKEGFGKKHDMKEDEPKQTVEEKPEVCIERLVNSWEDTTNTNRYSGSKTDEVSLPKNTSCSRPRPSSRYFAPHPPHPTLIDFNLSYKKSRHSFARQLQCRKTPGGQRPSKAYQIGLHTVKDPRPTQQIHGNDFTNDRNLGSVVLRPLPPSP